MQGNSHEQIGNSKESSKEEKIRESLRKLHEQFYDAEGNEKKGFGRLRQIATSAGFTVLFHWLTDTRTFKVVEGEFLHGLFERDMNVQRFNILVDRIIADEEYMKRAEGNYLDGLEELQNFLIDNGMVPNKGLDIAEAKKLAGKIGVPERELGFEGEEDKS